MTFSIDDHAEDNAAQLWNLIEATIEQFKGFNIECSYDAQTKELLNELQANGMLRWSDIDNPHSHYARIEFVQSRSGRSM
jgi:hypothetical protein